MSRGVRQPLLESVSPCEAEACVDDLSEGVGPDRSAHPRDPCVDDEDGGESGLRLPKQVQDPKRQLRWTNII